MAYLHYIITVEFEFSASVAASSRRKNMRGRVGAGHTRGRAHEGDYKANVAGGDLVGDVTQGMARASVSTGNVKGFMGGENG